MRGRARVTEVTNHIFDRKPNLVLLHIPRKTYSQHTHTQIHARARKNARSLKRNTTDCKKQNNYPYLSKKHKFSARLPDLWLVHLNSLSIGSHIKSYICQIYDCINWENWQEKVLRKSYSVGENIIRQTSKHDKYIWRSSDILKIKWFSSWQMTIKIGHWWSRRTTRMFLWQMIWK